MSDVNLNQGKYRVQDLMKEPLREQTAIKGMYALEISQTAASQLFADPARFLDSRGIPSGGGEFVLQIKKGPHAGGSSHGAPGSIGSGGSGVIIISWGDGTTSVLLGY